MADKFPVDVAQVVALFLESVFFGIYLVTFGMVMYALFSRAPGRRPLSQSFVLFAVTLALFFVATLDEAVLLRHILEAFIWFKGPGGAVADFNRLSDWIGVTKAITYACQTAIADGMLTYRCFIVYGRNWWIFFGLGLLWVAGLCSGIYPACIEATAHRNSLLTSNELKPWLTAILAISLVLNITATGLILFKIWQVQKRNAEVFLCDSYGSENNEPLKRVIRTMIESGLIYTLSVVILMIIYVANSNALYGVSDAIVQIIGISFNLIIIRISQGQSLETTALRSPMLNGGMVMSFADPDRLRDERIQLHDRHNQNSGFLDEGIEVSELSAKRPDSSGVSTVAVHFQQDITIDASPDVDNSVLEALPSVNIVEDNA